MRFRRLGGLLALLLVALGGGALGVHLWAERELAAQRADTARRIAEARSTSATATALLASGRYDFAARASHALLEQALRGFAGYRQLTRRGNRFRIDDLEVRLLDGYAELRAHADFEWRLGLYHGPVIATYAAFARTTAEGDTALYFRVLSVEPLAPWPVFGRWLAPLLTLRLQRSLQVPELRLPLQVRRARSAAPEASRPPAAPDDRRRRNVRLSLGPAWELGARRALPYVTPTELGVVIEAQGDGEPDAERVASSPAADEIEVAARVGFLADLVMHTFRKGGGASLEIARVPRVWSRPAKLARTEFENTVDIERLRGTVEVESLTTQAASGSFQVNADLAGRFAGMLRGTLYGVAFTVPTAVRSRATVTLPVRFEQRDGGLGLELGGDALTLPLDVAATIGGRDLRFEYLLPVRPELVARVSELPGLVLRTLQVPTRVERGKILESRGVPLYVEWRVDLPEGQAEFVHAHGSVRLGERR
ncbi:MAG: hypothetical protein ACM3OB_05270 [Acidobacteriota bacterium]